MDAVAYVVLEHTVNSRRMRARAVATEFVSNINASTVCSSCGAQPIEWHREEHEQKPNSRVSSLRTQGGSIARIQQEMDLCVPLCRSCHMKVDGRLNRLRQASPQKKGQIYVDPSPCSCCLRLAKPLRKGLCTGCYNHHSGLRLRKTNSCDGCCSTGGNNGLV